MQEFTRKIGEIKVSAMGLGCWAIGGQFFLDGKADGYGNVENGESIRAVRQAYDLGITFFDTADAYGAGHSEVLLGKALKGIRDKVVIASKFGNLYNEETKEVSGVDSSPAYIRKALKESLRRLQTDYIDLYLLHIWSLPKEEAEIVAETLDELVQEGLIRAYGWSTDLLDCAKMFASRKNCSAIEHNLNIFESAEAIIDICESNNLASINRSPLAMGLLSGKFNTNTKLPQNDVRGAGHEWVQYFEDGKPKQEFLDKLSSVREILTSGGRSLVQGALAYIWAVGDNTIPIPGFRNVKQAEENARAMEFGPLSKEQINEIDYILGRK
ncbi:aldo/keto reductase [Halocella sp. SP3-1]|uniref:aldo/keto reductase n=1 Tax=Halocella sp. SP3-1 TaxID=2382161 RepID=UPI000F75D84C|nr:aldo/keto reductase [Halocella sp. SP3-1]AZO94869.1 aldo/keto reductase [Halocella sp. SP3-1]